MQATKHFFNDVKHMDDLSNQTNRLVKDIINYENEIYKDWKKITLDYSI